MPQQNNSPLASSMQRALPEHSYTFILLTLCAHTELWDGDVWRSSTRVTAILQTKLCSLFTQLISTTRRKRSLPGIYKARKLKLQFGQKY